MLTFGDHFDIHASNLQIFHDLNVQHHIIFCTLDNAHCIPNIFILVSSNIHLTILIYLTKAIFILYLMEY